MTFRKLGGSRVLIVEDEYLLADDARSILAEAGADVIGPVATVAEARAIVEAGTAIDAVLLDLNLRGEKALEVADALDIRAIPFALVTGYDRSALPARFGEAARVEKPIDPQRLVEVLETLVTGTGGIGAA